MRFLMLSSGWAWYLVKWMCKLFSLHIFLIQSLPYSPIHAILSSHLTYITIYFLSCILSRSNRLLRSKTEVSSLCSSVELDCGNVVSDTATGLLSNNFFEQTCHDTLSMLQQRENVPWAAVVVCANDGSPVCVSGSRSESGANALVLLLVDGGKKFFCLECLDDA